MQHPRPDSGATEKGLTDDLWLLMQECWTRYPSQRPGMDVVVKRLGAVEAEIGAVIPELEILKLPKTLDTLSLPTSLRILPHLCGELKRQVASTVTMPLKTVKTPSGSYTLYDECGEGIRFVSPLVGLGLLSVSSSMSYKVTLSTSLSTWLRIQVQAIENRCIRNRIR